jgi:hypothetical protein
VTYGTIIIQIREIVEFESHFYMSRICRKTFFFKLEPNNWLFLVGLCPVAYLQTVFWSSVPFWRKLLGHILWMPGMNLYIYWEYAEWICLYTQNTWNEAVSIQRICEIRYIFDRNFAMHIHWICGMNLLYTDNTRTDLFVYWEYAEWNCTVPILRK